MEGQTVVKEPETELKFLVVGIQQAESHFVGIFVNMASLSADHIIDLMHLRNGTGLHFQAFVPDAGVGTQTQLHAVQNNPLPGRKPEHDLPFDLVPEYGYVEASVRRLEPISAAAADQYGCGCK